MVRCKWNVDRTWDRTPQRDLQFYRYELDILDGSAIVWEPYPNDILETLTQVCREGSQIWWARTPLICFQTVEMHVPNRVLSLFGFYQHIPEPVEQLPRIERKRRRDWASKHSVLIDQWADRANQVQNERCPMTLHEEYMRWHWGITRHWTIRSVPPPIAYQPAVVYERELVIYLTELS